MSVLILVSNGAIQRSFRICSQDRLFGCQIGCLVVRSVALRSATQTSDRKIVPDRQIGTARSAPDRERPPRINRLGVPEEKLKTQGKVLDCVQIFPSSGSQAAPRQVSISPSCFRVDCPGQRNVATCTMAFGDHDT